MTEIILIAASYLAGSLPFGYWLVRIFRHADIRTLGSKSTGMTNVWRNFGWRFGVATLLLDVAKGAAPALAALHWSGPLAASVAGIVAMLGHSYSVLLGFRGGKSVATGAGAALALFPAGVGIAALAWAITFFTLRYASVASLAAGTAFLVAAVALGEEWPVIAFAALAFAFVALRHRANIARLRAGTEPRARLRRATSESGS
ncbi:MAG: acyl phosphate:glycerol-3-phosphate acyltransferase [Gaiellales bacterium]|nr:acyl phosphate:glycerol-3-phosphate acyltransferase [Gaiellales bacterium]